MKISSKARYAILAMIELARSTDFVSVAELAERRGIPRTFLEQVLLNLKNEGLTVSRRGPDGGYALSTTADRIRLADIYTAVEGPLRLRNERPRGGSDSEAVSDDERVWGGLEDAVLRYMNGVTLIDLTEPDADGEMRASPAHQYTFSI